MDTQFGARQRRWRRRLSSRASKRSELRLGCHPETPVIEPCPELGMVQKRVTGQGGWGRRPQGDAPRSAAARTRGSLTSGQLDPSHPALVSRADPGVEPGPIPGTSSLSLSRLPAWPMLRSPLRERPVIDAVLQVSHATKCYILGGCAIEKTSMFARNH